MDTNNLIAYLPFDSDTTTDLCGGTWTETGTPAIVDGALSLNGSSYIYNDNIAAQIGSSSWTIHWRANCTNSNERVMLGTYNAKYGTSGTGTDKWIRVGYFSGKPLVEFWGPQLSGDTSVPLNENHHYALSYADNILYFFIDGVLQGTRSLEVILGGTFRIGVSPGRTNSYEHFIGSIDNFIVLKGTAWTENFTPPTDSDYAALKFALGATTAPLSLAVDTERRISNRVEVIADVERRFKWRYYNNWWRDKRLNRYRNSCWKFNCDWRHINW